MNTRTKGLILCNYIADQIVAKGLDPKARADGGSGAGNREKADISTSMLILGRQAGIEAKNQAALHMSDWWKQTCKLEILDEEPILVYKEFGEPLENSKAVVYLDTLLELIRASGGTTKPVEAVITPQMARDTTYAIQSLIMACKKVLKLMDNPSLK